MAGLDDYQFYTNLKENDSPFWQKYDSQFPDEPKTINRPSNFPNEFENSTNKASMEKSLISDKIALDPVSKKDVNLDKYGEVSITLVSLCAENLLGHPFIVLRRQCQVNVSSHRYHLQPLTLIPALIHLQSYQGLSVLWKGLGSVLTIKGITLALEDCLSKFTPWPKEISPHSSLKSIGQHLLLKCTALAIITPFYSASLVETIQSDITSESPGVFDVFKEGLCRLLSFTQPQTGRMLPVWLLIVPTVVHGLLQYVAGNAVSTVTYQCLRSSHKKDMTKQGALSKDASLTEASMRLQSTYFGHLFSDVLLFPLEMILHRLHLQGTRTIIDSLDSGYEVKPILTRYEGFFDCIATTFREEGFWGYYKGFGALCLQYAVYGIVLKFGHIIIKEVTALFAPALKKPTHDHIVPLVPGASYTPGSAGTHGTSSLHSSPLHSARNKGKVNYQNKARDEYQDQIGNRLYQSNSVDLGDLSDFSMPDVRPVNRLSEFEIKNEIQRHRDSLSRKD